MSFWTNACPAPTIICSLSGGVDSTTLVAEMVRDGCRVTGAFFDYGQKHLEAEHEAAKGVAFEYGIPLKVFRIPEGWRLGKNTSSLIAGSPREVPQGPYEDFIPSTYVPFRNPLFVSILASYAYDNKIDLVALGAHMGDWRQDNYPDTAPKCLDPLGEAVSAGTGNKVALHVPYLTWTKSEIVARGLELGVDYSKTWSCYMGDKSGPCGTCATCIERDKALLEGRTLYEKNRNVGISPQ